MPFVLDASVTACWAFEDEESAMARAAFQRLSQDQARVPALWWFEIRNSVIVNERRGRLKPDFTESFLRLLATLPIHIDRTPSEPAILRLARTHRLTVYDAAYLELAQRGGLPIATLDAALTRAATAEGVALFEAR